MGTPHGRMTVAFKLILGLSCLQGAFASSCTVCVSNSKVWCYKDRQCHTPSSPSNPCYNAQCVSTSFFSTCNCKSCSDTSCEVQFVDTATTSGGNGKGHSFAVAMADVDGDGHVDLYVLNVGTANKLYLNDGNGVFHDVTETARVGDTGMGQGVSFADVDGDSDLDIFVANFKEASVLYINDGTGKFTDNTTAAGLAVDEASFGATFGDVNGDGLVDLFVSNSEVANRLYLGNGKGSFTDVTASAGVGDTGDARACVLADFDGDMDLDLHVVNTRSANVIYFNDGKGKFHDGTAEAGVGSKLITQGMNVADVDGDGDLDILNTDWSYSNILYINDGSGKFSDGTRSAGVGGVIVGQGAAFGDVNGDGRLDLFVDSWGTPPLGTSETTNQLYINGAGFNTSAPAWLKVRPLNKNGHATLLGAEVRLFKAGSKVPLATRVIDGGSGFGPQNAYDAFFGLKGNGTTAFDLEIRPPDGVWVDKVVNPLLGGVLPYQVISANCYGPSPSRKEPTVSIH